MLLTRVPAAARQRHNLLVSCHAKSYFPFRVESRKERELRYRAGACRRRQPPPLRFAGMRETFARRKNLDAYLRYLARGSDLFCPRKAGDRSGITASALFHALGGKSSELLVES